MTNSTTVSATLAALGASGWSVNGGYGADGFEALPVIGTVSADPTGVSDASLAFSMIVAKAGGRRGIIIVPPGKFTAQGIPCYPGLYFQGAGRGALDESTGTSINLPAGATSNMFLCTSPTNDFIGGGVADMDLNGGLLRTASPTRDCFDFSAVVGEVHRFYVRRCYVHNFRDAWHGAVEAGGRDRSPTFVDCDIWHNARAFYTSEHPIFSGVNDVRYNNYGITGPTSGSQPYDIFLTGQKFNYNERAIAPQPGGANFSSIWANHTSFFKNVILDAAIRATSSFVNCLFVAETPITVGVISGDGTTTTITTATAHERSVGDPVIFSGTGVAALDFAGGAVRTLTVSAVVSTTQFRCLSAYAGSTSGGKLFRGASHLEITGSNNKVNENQFRSELANDIKPDWSIYVNAPGQSLVGLSVAGNTYAMLQTDNASATIWTRFLGVNCTQMRQLKVLGTLCRNVGQFFEAEGATSIDNYDISHNQWHCNVGIGATRAVARMLTTTFGGIFSFNIHRAESTEGGQYVIDWNATRAMTVGNVLRHGRGLWTALVNITARSTAGAGEGASIGTSATGKVTFAAGPGVITDTPGFATLNQVSAF